MPSISKLEVRGFRGVLRSQSLPFDGKSVLLFGENGTGKSSFVDALEWLFTGCLSTLDGRAQELSSESHAKHIRFAGSPYVAVTFSPPDSVTVDSSTSASTLSVAVQRYLAAAKENLFVLRRSQLTRFIESQPRDRYSLLRPFIPLGGIDKLEGELREVTEALKRESEQAGIRTRRLFGELQSRLPGVPASALQFETGLAVPLSTLLEEVGLPPIVSISEIPERVKSIETILSEFGDLSLQGEILSSLNALDQVKGAIPRREIEAALQSVAELRKIDLDTSSIFYEVVLEQGCTWIQNDRSENCPLCEQPIDLERVVVRVRERLHAVRELVHLRKRARDLTGRALEAIRSAERLLGSAAETVRLASEGANGNELHELRSVLTTLGEALQRPVREVDPDALRALATRLGDDSPIVAGISALRDQLSSTLSLLPSRDRAQNLLALRQKLVDVSRLWSEYQESLSARVSALLVADTAEKTYGHCQAARKEVVQSFYDELSADINKIYLQFHPQEKHGGLRLEVREAVQASAQLRGSFYDRTDEDVRAYYSDAHLDTLGLSIFLALARWHRKTHPSFNLLVLDDVLNSVDNQHLVRVSEFLLKEFSDYQILLTTHDRIWFEHLRDIQSRCRVANRFVNKIIHKWDIDEGPDLREPQDERRDLDLLLKDGEARDIASTAGRLLEHVLQEMRYSFRLGIEARRGERYEIGDLWPKFQSAIRKNYQSLYEAAKAAIDALDVQWPLRNWIGAHFNEWSGRVSRQSSVEFGKAVRDLFDFLYCEDCRRFVEPSATPLGQVACQCGGKIYPAPGKKGAIPSSRSELIARTQGTLKDAKLDTKVFAEIRQADAASEH